MPALREELDGDDESEKKVQQYTYLIHSIDTEDLTICYSGMGFYPLRNCA
jgi:hypothetical protein